MGDFGRYLARIIKAAFKGPAGRVRAIPFYLSVVTGAARLLGYDIVLEVPTSIVAACSFLSAVAIGFIWGPYVVYSEERDRAQRAESLLSPRAKYQDIADELAKFEGWGTRLRHSRQGASNTQEWIQAYANWHNELHEWAKKYLPRAEYVQIEKVRAPLPPVRGVLEFDREHPLDIRLRVIRGLVDQYQGMAHGR